MSLRRKLLIQRNIQSYKEEEEDREREREETKNGIKMTRERCERSKTRLDLDDNLRLRWFSKKE